MRPGCQASRLAVWRRERSALDSTPRPTDVGPGISTWKRWYRMIRLRCIRTSPDTPSMLRFVADYKGRGREGDPTAGRGWRSYCLAIVSYWLREGLRLLKNPRRLAGSRRSTGQLALREPSSAV